MGAFGQMGAFLGKKSVGAQDSIGNAFKLKKISDDPYLAQKLAISILDQQNLCVLCKQQGKHPRQVQLKHTQQTYNNRSATLICVVNQE